MNQPDPNSPTTQWARELRSATNKLTPAERAFYFNHGIELIYHDDQPALEAFRAALDNPAAWVISPPSATPSLPLPSNPC